MPKETTDKMHEALRLIKRGKSPQQAAILAGVARQSIYKSAGYKEHRAEQLKKRAQVQS